MGKRIARGAAFLAAGVLLFLFLQELLLPHYEAGATAIAGGFYRREENSVEVLSLGSSQPILGLDIPRLEETLGVSVCTFGATKQRLTTTAYYLREALKTQSPRVILVELGQFFFPEEGEPLADGQVVAWSYPAMKISRDKYESLLELYEGDTARAAAQCFTPLLPYHSRWSSLTGSDIAEFFRLVDHEEIAPGGFIGSDTHSEVTVAFTGEDEGTAKRIPPTTPAAIDEIIALSEKATPPPHKTSLL